MVFDKTGTLTKDSLDLLGVVPFNSFLGAFDEETCDFTSESFSEWCLCCASCHSLTLYEGPVVGDVLEVKMFEGTEWILEEPGGENHDEGHGKESNEKNQRSNNIDMSHEVSKFDRLVPTIVKRKDFEIGILRQFPFSSAFSRNSVVVRVLHERFFRVFCKGAPEKIFSLCLSSTLPYNSFEVLSYYTKRGIRVLALAGKALPCDINLLGIHRAQESIWSQI